MTLTTTTNTASYTGDNVTTVFSVPFLFYAASDLVVKIDGTVTTAYSVSGVGNANGGSITFTSAPASSAAITIQRIVPYTQLTDFQNFDGNPSEVTEKQFDLIAMMSQQIAEENSRSILVPVGTTLTNNEISGTINSTLKVLTITSSGVTASAITAVSIGGDVDTILTGEQDNDIIIYSGGNFVNTTSLDGDYTFTGTNEFDGSVDFNGNAAMKAKFQLAYDGERTISGGIITTTGAYHAIATEAAAASDNLDTINTTATGLITFFRAGDDAETVVVKHNTGNIYVPTATDISLDTVNRVVGTIYDSTLSKHIVLFDGTTKEYVDAEIAGLATTILHIRHTTSSGTAGGTATTASWTKRTLNTTVVNEISGASIASSVITLPAGTYEASGFSIMRATGDSQTRLYDTDNTTDLCTGLVITSQDYTPHPLQGKFTLAGETDLELQYYASSTSGTEDLGGPGTFGTNIFADLIIRKIG